MYILQSNVDGESFEVDQKVIDASELLKNVCAMTEITEPITVDCSSFALSLFITLINHYETLTDEHDIEFEIELFATFTIERFIELVREMCVLDSDFFLDSIADIILNQIDGMSYKQLKEYFQFETDFTAQERKAATENRLEFLLSIDVGILKFPFPSANFLSLRNKFYIPMNVLLARIVQRSCESTAFELSLINKALKNENDRYFIKVKSFICGDKCTVSFGRRYDQHKVENFDVIKSRKVMSDSVTLVYESQNQTVSNVLKSSYMDFVITSTPLNVEFKWNKDNIYDFDVTQCPFPSISFSFSFISMNFKECYNQLIATDFSKEIKIQNFEFDGLTREYFTMHKKAKAKKFHKIEMQYGDIQYLPNYISFFNTYTERDGVLISQRKLFHFADSYDRKKGTYHYHIEHVLEYLHLSSNDDVYCSCKTGCRAKSGCKCRKSGTPCNFRCHVKNKTAKCSNNG